MINKPQPPFSGSNLKPKALNGLPTFLRGPNAPILTLLGYTNRHSRKWFIARLKHCDRLKMIHKRFPHVSDDQLIEFAYSEQKARFVSFWATVSRNSATPIEVARKLVVPDILTILLHAYDPDCFDTPYDETCIGPLNVDIIHSNTTAAFESMDAPAAVREVFDLRYLNLWPKLVIDIENIASADEGQSRRIVGAVFALASAYNSPELIDSAIECSAGRLLPAFSSIIQESPNHDTNESQSSHIKEWSVLVKDLQRLAGKLVDDASTGLLDEIETTVIELRKTAALRQSLEDDKQWIEMFFTSLRNCGDQPDLKWFADEIGRIETSCLKSDLSPSQLKAKLVPIADTLPKHLADSREITDAIRENLDSLAKLNESITLAPIHQRQQLRIKESSCHMELNELRERQSELETYIIEALQYIDDALHTQILGEKPSTRTPEQELSRSQPPAPEPQPPTPELVTPEIPSLSPSSALSEPKQAAAPKSDPITPEPVLPDQARVYDTSPIVPQRPLTPPLEQVTSGPINEHPHPTHHELTTLSDRSPADLLATLADNPAELRDEEWATLVRLQRGWLERRQPLRAWLLSHAADRPRSSPTESVQALALLPVWACRLLLVLSDAKLPLADEETESLYKIRTLDNDQKELVTLWLTATLLEGTTEKPLRVARLVSPQQFDLAPHSLALCCANYLLTPVFNGGSLRPPKTGAELDRQYQLAIKNAQDILNPSRNNYQKAWVRAFWRKLTSNDGHMGQLLAEAKQGRFPPQTLSPDAIVEGLPEWSEILAAYKRNMTNRIDEFAGLIESARAAYDSAQEALKSDQSKIPKHAVLEILASIQRQPGNGWWLETIRSGISDL